jgi:PAS domain S-box-containing protein
MCLSAEIVIRCRWKSVLVRYGIAVAAIVLATLIRKALDPILENTAPFSAYYAAVMFAAWYGGIGPSLVALLGGAILADLLFIEPHLSLLAFNLEHQLGLGLYLVVGIIVAALSESLHASRRRIDLAHSEVADANLGLQDEIAERQQAERWLLESEQRFRGYFEQGMVGMVMISADRKFVEVNHRVCQMLGYSEAELSGKNWTDVVYPDDRRQEEMTFNGLLDGLAQGYITDQRFVRKDGRALYSGLSAQCMRRSDRSVDCILVLVQDLTNKHLAEEAARLAQEQLLEQQRNQHRQVESELAEVKHQLIRKTRLAAIGQVSASIANDLRSPIAAMSNTVTLLKRCSRENPSQFAEYISFLEREIQTTSQIIDSLTEMARAETPSRSTPTCLA